MNMLKREDLIRDKTGRFFCHHSLWEDAKNGLYNLGSDKNLIDLSIALLSNSDDFSEVMANLKLNWPYSYFVNVSNKTQNRKAWLGQAACNYNHGAEFNLTILAWQSMNDSARLLANQAAQKVIDVFERENYGQDLFRSRCSKRCERTYNMDFR